MEIRKWSGLFLAVHGVRCVLLPHPPVPESAEACGYFLQSQSHLHPGRTCDRETLLRYIQTNLCQDSWKSPGKPTWAVRINLKWIKLSITYSLLPLMWFELWKKANIHVLLCHSNRNLVWQTVCYILLPPRGG